MPHRPVPTRSQQRRPSRRGFATVLVLVVIGIASIVLVSLQTTAWRGAAAGRQAVSYVRAKWAARAGVEAVIAKLAADTLQPDPNSAYAVRDDLAIVAEAKFSDASRNVRSSYSIRHWDDGKEMDGPADAHAKLNINWMTADALLLIPNMTEDVADSILDWIDADDDPQPLGQESGYYLSRPIPYTPRNGPMRTIQELELVAGVTPDLVRGEDWNLSGDLDPEEDLAETLPGSNLRPNPDGKLDAGWSAFLTAASADGGYAASGQPRLDLTTASADDIARRLTVTSDQGEAIRAHVAANPSTTLADFLRQDLPTMAAADNPPTTPGAQLTLARIQALTNDQLALLFDEAWVGDPAAKPTPGRLNVNTCAAETLQYVPGIDSSLADAIVVERNSRSTGFLNVLDLLSVPAMTRDRLADLLKYLDVRSNVYVVTSRGRDAASGMEVVITATVDRSTLPIAIKDLIVR